MNMFVEEAKKRFRGSRGEGRLSRPLRLMCLGCSCKEIKLFLVNCAAETRNVPHRQVVYTGSLSTFAKTTPQSATVCYSLLQSAIYCYMLALHRVK